jgi:hypothetical protein
MSLIVPFSHAPVMRSAMIGSLAVPATYWLARQLSGILNYAADCTKSFLLACRLPAMLIDHYACSWPIRSIQHEDVVRVTFSDRDFTRSLTDSS